MNGTHRATRAAIATVVTSTFSRSGADLEVATRAPAAAVEESKALLLPQVTYREFRRFLGP